MRRVADPDGIAVGGPATCYALDAKATANRIRGKLTYGVPLARASASRQVNRRRVEFVKFFTSFAALDLLLVGP